MVVVTGVIITRLFGFVKWSSGTYHFVRYNQVFAITEFVMSEFYCTL